MTPFRLLAAALLTICLSACASGPPPADQVLAPTPILDNSGQYMSPFTQDGVLAPWTDKAINVKLATTVGSTLGAAAGQQVMGQIPLVGGFLGDYAGRTIARDIALKSIGGEEYIKSTSDISFNSLDDLSVYIYAKNSSHPQYQDALSATMEIYPDLKGKYQTAILHAPTKAPQ